MLTHGQTVKQQSLENDDGMKKQTDNFMGTLNDKQVILRTI